VHLDDIEETRRGKREEEKVVENGKGSKREPREVSERDLEVLSSKKNL